MDLDTRFSVPQQVLSRLVGDETVLLNLETGIYFGLDGVGKLIWEMIGEGKSPAEAVAIIVAEYEVDEQQAQTDVIAFVGDLVNKGLILEGRA